LFLLAYPIFVLASFGMGIRLLSLFKYEPSSKLVHFFLAIVLGYAFTGQLIFILGLLHLLYSWLIWILFIAVILLNGGIIVLFFREIRWSDTIESIRNANFYERAFFFMSIMVLLLHAFFSLAPQIHWDALSHHYLVPDYFLKKHAIIDFPDVIFSYYPSMIEMQYLAAMALGGEITANLIGNSHCIIFYIGFYALAIQFFKNWKIGIWGGLILLSTQNIHVHFEGGWNDIGVSLFIMTAVMTAIMFTKNEHRGLLFLSAIFMGAALSSKHYAWFPFFFTVGYLKLHMLVGKRNLVNAISITLKYLLIALLIPLLWYIRSYIYTGNPVYPFSVFGLFPTYDLPPFVLSSWVNTGFKRNILTFFAYPYYLILGKFWVPGLTGRFPYLLFLLPLSLVDLKIREIRASWYFIIWTLIVMYFVAPFETRYMLYILPFCACLVGFVVTYIRLKITIGKAMLLPVLFFAFIIPFSLNLKIFEHYFQDRTRVILKKEWRDQYLFRQSNNYVMLHWMNYHLPEDSLTLCLENKLYRLDKNFVTWYGMKVKYPETAVEAMEKNYAHHNTHMFLGEGGMAQAYILWHIYHLMPDENGYVEFRINDVLLNLLDEPIPQRKFWILSQLGIIRDMDRWGFEKSQRDGETWYRTKKDNLDKALANQAAIILVDIFKEMESKKWIELADDEAYDGLNMVFKFNYDKFFEDTSLNSQP
jgi:hypothetical protein